MIKNVQLLLFAYSLCLLFACASPKKQYSCTWKPDITGPHDAAFCVDYGVKDESGGSSMPVLEGPDKKDVKQINGLDLFVDPAKVSTIKKKAASGRKLKCDYIWISAKAEIQPETGQYWSPQWDSDERKISKRLFPFYKVLIQQLYDAKCVKK